MDEERYEFTRIIGKGRTGGVYEATDHQLQRKVAVRRFYCAKGDSTVRGWEEIFLNLTHHLSNLHHSSLLGVLEGEVDDDGAYLIYQLIDGDTLAKLVDLGPLKEADVYDMAQQLLEALQVTHNNGFIHGAMSTGSITLIERPRGGYQAIINDLGLSRLAPLIQGVDSAYARMADPVIMPPEMFDDKEPTSKSDLYMLGHLIYLSLIGGHPFAEIDLAELSRAHREGSLPPITKYRDDLCPNFIEWIAKLTECDVDKRFSGASEALHNMPGLTQKEQRNTTQSAAPKLVVPKLPNKIIHTATVETLPVYIPIKKSGSKRIVGIISIAALLLIGVVILMGSSNEAQHSTTDTEIAVATSETLPIEPDEDAFNSINTTPVTLPISASLIPSLSPHKEVCYASQLTQPIATDHLNITNCLCDDWIIYEGRSLKNETKSHPKGDIIQATTQIGSFRQLEHPIDLVRFYQTEIDAFIVPALFVDSKRCNFAPGDGWKVKLVSPEGPPEQKIQIHSHFTTWNCDGIISYRDGNGELIGKPKRYDSEYSNTSFGTIDTLHNLKPGGTYFIEFTASEPKSGKNLGLSFNGLRIKALNN